MYTVYTKSYVAKDSPDNLGEELTMNFEVPS